MVRVDRSEVGRRGTCVRGFARVGVPAGYAWCLVDDRRPRIENASDGGMLAREGKSFRWMSSFTGGHAMPPLGLAEFVGGDCVSISDQGLVEDLSGLTAQFALTRASVGQ